MAGYNPLNEPADSQHKRLISFYNRVYKSIRAIDQNHILFLDGNTFAADFSQFGDAYKNWSNTVYSIHDYSGFGFPSSPETYVGSDEQKKKRSGTESGDRSMRDSNMTGKPLKKSIKQGSAF